jgi:hypothetical protein
MEIQFKKFRSVATVKEETRRYSSQLKPNPTQMT